jgi:demethoxyubiquinone hydroxylase (CLK1/Coq7/Cat5 family)
MNRGRPGQRWQVFSQQLHSFTGRHQQTRPSFLLPMSRAFAFMRVDGLSSHLISLPVAAANTHSF